MRPPRLTIRSIMLALVLLGVNLAALDSVLHPRPSGPYIRSLGDRGTQCRYYEDRSFWTENEHPKLT